MISALKTKDLISPEHLAEQRVLQALAPLGRDDVWRTHVQDVLDVLDAYDCGSVLDYGCGDGALGRALLEQRRVAVREYDPAIDGKSNLPLFADLVTCLYVLEHVEADRLNLVLAHIRGLARKAVCVVVVTSVERDASWWRAVVEAAGFRVQPDELITADVWDAVLVP